ncbi:MAG: ComEC/Rec2 family competence protein [Candidatus Dormibacteria bacterium]
MTQPTLRLTLVAGAFAAAVAAPGEGGWAVAAVLLGALAATWLLLHHARAATCCVVALAVVAGATRGVTALSHGRGPGDVAGHLDAGATVLRGRVADAGVPGRDDTVVVDVDELATVSGRWRVGGRVVVQPLSPVTTLPGDLVDVEAPRLRAPPQRPGSLGASSLDRVGVVAVASAARLTLLAPGPVSIPRLAEQARRALAAAVTATVPEPIATLLLGVALGIHQGLPGTVRAPLQNAGLVHLVAVSGLKVALLAALIAALGRARRWPRRLTVISTVALLGTYVVVSGAGVAAIRSSLVVLAGLLLARDGRRPDAVALLALCAALLLGLDPAVATDVSFQLSFLGTAGILILAAPLASRLPGPRAVAEALAVTGAAQLATVSVTGGTFGVVSLVAPFANTLVLPLLPIVIVLGGGGAALTAFLPGVGPALGWLPLQVAALATQAILAVAEGASAIPLAAVAVPSWPAAWTWACAGAWAAAGAAWLLRGRGRGGRPAVSGLAMAALAGAVAAGVAGATSAGAATGMRVTVLAVGNGTAVLVRPAGGGLVLVDTGADSAALLAALGRTVSLLDRRLDAVVLTATDHASGGAVAALSGHYAVGALVVSQPLPRALEDAAASLAGAGTAVTAVGEDAWTLGGARFRCLPSAPAPVAPCVLEVSDAGASLLVTGSLPITAQDEVSGMQGSRLRADLVVGPPAIALDPALLAAARPSLVAVPALRLPPGTAALGVPVDVTGRDGDLEYDTGSSGMWRQPW